MQKPGLVARETPFEAEQLTITVDGAETGRVPGTPSRASTTRHDSTVPVKQLLRWQDDGGA